MPNDITIGAPAAGGQQSVTFVSSVYSSGVTLTGKKIRVNGLLYVDRSFRLFNCIVELEPGARIIPETPGTYQLQAYNSTFYSCQQMWQGFLVRNGRRILLNNCRIEDAEYAVTLDDGATAALARNTFNRNNVGICNGVALPGLSGFNLVYFGNNRFTCSAPQLPSYTFPIPPAGWNNISFAGIWLRNTVCAFNTSDAPTVFRDVAVGIYMENSDGVFSGIDAADHTDFLSAFGVETACGIVAINSTLTVSDAKFDHARYGIRAIGTSLEVSDCEFRVDGISGIFSDQNTFTDYIRIRNNQLELTNTNYNGQSPLVRTGIHVLRNVKPGSGLDASVDIASNTINIRGLEVSSTLFEQIGIYLTAPLPSLDFARIHNANNINIFGQYEHPQTGIEVWPGISDRCEVRSNNIDFREFLSTLEESKLRWGVSVLNGKGMAQVVEGNRSFASGPLPPGSLTAHWNSHCGLHLFRTWNMTVCLNDVDRSRQGIHYVGDCLPGHYFGQNIMRRHRYSLLIQNFNPSQEFGRIGVHTRTANLWLNDFPAQILGTNIPGQNRLVVLADALPHKPQQTTPQLFEVDDMGPQDLRCTGPGFQGGGEEDFLPDDHLEGESEGAALFDLRKDLLFQYYRLSETGASAEWQAFHATYAGTPEDRLAYAAYLSVRAADQGAAEYALLDSLYAQRDVLAGSLTGLAQDTLSGYPATLLDDWKTNFAERADLKELIAGARSFWIDSAQATLNGISATELQIVCWAALQALELKLLRGLQADSADIAALYVIAAQCPDEVGAAAATARNLLKALGEQVVRPDEEEGLSANCIGARRKNRPAPAAVATPLLLSPNPAQTAAVVEMPESLSGIWQIIGADGRLAAEGAFEAQAQLRLDLTRIPNGVYVLRVQASDGKTYQARLVIAR